MIDIKTYKFDFSRKIPVTDETLLAEARERGFIDPDNEYNQMAFKLLRYGGVPVFKEGLDENFRKNAWNWCLAFFKSFEPKIEHKLAICGMLMNELIFEIRPLEK